MEVFLDKIIAPLCINSMNFSQKPLQSSRNESDLFKYQSFVWQILIQVSSYSISLLLHLQLYRIFVDYVSFCPGLRVLLVIS